jgi:glucose/arabinose dehydrogenase
MPRVAVLALVLAALLLPGSARADDAPVLPPGFAQSTAWTVRGYATALRFAPDGRVFVASKDGIVSVFDGPGDSLPTTYADLRLQVYDSWDRGLLGLAVDPAFATGRPYIYVLYTYDKAPDSPLMPRWSDVCPTPPGPNDDGCVVTARLSRIAPDGTETVLLDDFCQQFPSHSIGSLNFGPDGALYVSAGEGAAYNAVDYGQHGIPLNPCGDPPGGVGAVQAPPDAEGGALRAQSFARPASEPATLGGAILRVDPDTGAALPDNPAAANPDPLRRRIVAYGLRNPFRFTFRPGTGELWVGDVGFGAWEEIDRVPDLTRVRNYGWPCYEGAVRQDS